jgi:lipid A disaccharide synthetase
LHAQYPDIDLTVVDGQSHLAMESADVVLLASGTATLEAALYKKPMVISYKVPWLTAQIMKRQGYLPYVGLPNILSGRFVVPELYRTTRRRRRWRARRCCNSMTRAILRSCGSISRRCTKP